MDPVTLILTALASGAAASLQDTATQAIKDAYAGLKGLIGKKFQGNPKAEVALQAHAEDPATWQKPMEQSIKDAGLNQDEDVLKLAALLVKLLEEQAAPKGGGQSTGAVSVTASQGSTAVGAIQVGGSTGSITIGSPAARPGAEEDPQRQTP